MSILFDIGGVRAALAEPLPDMLAYMAGRLTAASLLFVAVTLVLNAFGRHRARRRADRLETSGTG